jgi:hypothetical protein
MACSKCWWVPALASAGFAGLLCWLALLLMHVHIYTVIAPAPSTAPSTQTAPCPFWPAPLPQPDGRVAHFELVLCKSVDTYVRVKQNQNQVVWKWKKVSRHGEHCCRILGWRVLR